MKKHIPNAKKYVQLCGSLLVLGLNANGLLLNISSLPRSAFDIFGARIWGIRLQLLVLDWSNRVDAQPAPITTFSF